VLGLKWWLQGHTFTIDARIFELGAYDLIVGMDWLEHHSPMQCEWLNKRISFVHEGKMITLQGVIPQQVGQLTEISGEQLLKLHKGNDLWALVMLSQVSDEQCAVMVKVHLCP
jgi:hypothetical protein